MKLLHWNVHMWQDAEGKANTDAVADLIAEVSPDVVSLVEVDEQWGDPAELRAVAVRLGFCWVYVPAFEYRGEGGFGNALLSKQPFRAVQQWQLLPPRLYDGTEPSEPRAVVLAEVDVDERKVWVGSTHLPRHDKGMRAEAFSRLLGLLHRLDQPWALCGDFNQPASEWMPASKSVVPAPVVATYPADEPTEAIDYCVFEGITGGAEVLESTASDHRPLLIEAKPTQLTANG